MASTPGNVGISELPAAPTKQRTASRELTSSPEEAVGQAVPMTPPVDQGRLPTSSSSVASSWQPIETPTPTPAQQTDGSGSSGSGQQSASETKPVPIPVPVDQESVGEPTIRDILKQALMRRLTGRGGQGRSGQRPT